MSRNTRHALTYLIASLALVAACATPAVLFPGF
jgi:hypothetical protein